MQRPSFPRSVLRMSAGAIIWALHFGTVYWLTAITCTFGLGEARLPWFSPSAGLLGVTAVAFAAVLAVAVAAVWGGLSSIRNWMTAGVGAFAAIAIAWEGLVPALMLPAC